MLTQQFKLCSEKKKKKRSENNYYCSTDHYQSILEWHDFQMCRVSLRLLLFYVAWLLVVFGGVLVAVPDPSSSYLPVIGKEAEVNSTARKLAANYRPSKFKSRSSQYRASNLYSSSDHAASVASLSDIHTQIKRQMGLASIITQTSSLMSNKKLTFTPNITIDYPPNLVFRTSTRVSYESFTFLWDAFTAHDSMYFVFSRYLEWNHHFKLSRDLLITIPSLDIVDACSDLVKDPDVMTDFKYKRPNQVIICRIRSTALLDYWEVHNTNLIGVKIDIVGMKKAFNLTRLDVKFSAFTNHISTALRKLKSTIDVSSKDTKPSVLLGVTMIGPDVDASSIVTWMQYHLHLNVPYFQLYFMVALDSLSREYVDVLNVFHARCGGCFSVMQWYTFYVPGLVSLQEEPACSHLALINSVLHRLALYKRSLGARHSEYSSLRMWLMQIDVDDFLVPPEKKVGLHEHFSMLPSGVASVTFDNAYFYILPSSLVKDARNMTLFLQPSNHVMLEKFRFRSNFTYEDMASNVIIRESNMVLHTERPKLVHNVETILLAGAHHVVMMNKNDSEIYRNSDKYIYLHHVKTSRGRNIDEIQSPIVTSLSECCNHATSNL